MFGLFRMNLESICKKAKFYDEFNRVSVNSNNIIKPETEA